MARKVDQIVGRCHRMKGIAGHPYEALFALAMTSGMRPCEYMALTWNDLDLDHGTVSISRTLEWRKGGWQFADTKRSRSRRLVKLQAWVVGMLQEQTPTDLGDRRDNLVFRAKRGRPIRESRFVQCHFKPLQNRLDCPKSGSTTCATQPRPFHWQRGSRQR